ncbi:hypothetical protein [Burkholderia pyrrocinia]|uniref:hypothetical protein n=1 Tax=Burkholderia pyrrocinia TaxID=60550 RepID=UPI0011E4DD88|nr:hypothetical protein [Burkholderia pyrrocinia]
MTRIVVSPGSEKVEWMSAVREYRPVLAMVRRTTRGEIDIGTKKTPLRGRRARWPTAPPKLVC